VYRLLRIFVYDFVTARSVFVIQPQRLRQMRIVKRKMGPVFLVALIAHHAQNLIPRSSTLRINTVNLLFRDYSIQRDETKLRR